MSLAILFLLGLTVGSFLNVVIYRLPREKELTGRSFCPHCRQRLPWYSLLPLVSFGLQKGRCRYCRRKISWQYPLVELITGVLFILAGIRFLGGGFDPLDLAILTAHLAIISILLAIFVIDLRHLYIPDSLLIVGGAAAAVLYGVLLGAGSALPDYGAAFRSLLPGLAGIDSSGLTGRIGAALAGGGFFAIIILLTRGRGMGWGDAKLAGLMGLLMGGFPLLVGLWLAFVTGALVGLTLIIFAQQRLSSKMPFGPFLAGAALLLLLL